MVQKEVKKKAQAYGLMAIILASMCVALIYSYGTAPGILPNQNPTNVSPMNTFSSYDEMRTFLINKNPNLLTPAPEGVSYWTRPDGGFGYFTLNGAEKGMPMPAPTAAAAPSQIMWTETTGDTSHSNTNVQVAGVDESDTVKTDGKYLYVISNNTLFIMNANPQDAKVLSKISIPETTLSGLFLSQDGSRVVVIGSRYDYYYVNVTVETGEPGKVMPYTSYYTTDKTFIGVYDVSNKANPVLARNFTISGDYYNSNSRMIGNYVYAVVTQYVYLTNNSIIVPRVYTGDGFFDTSISSIYYANSSLETSGSYSYTTFVAINIMNDAEAAGNLTLMMGGAGTMYVSTNNIYVTYPDAIYDKIPVSSTSPSTQPSDVVTILPMPIMRMPIWQGTMIYRVHVDGSAFTFAAQGNVSGSVQNQYMMDEYNGYFRIVTTTYGGWLFASMDSSGASQQQTSVFTLDSNLNVVGKVENIGVGEDFYAARFMGDRCYLVTFNQIDPLFVIDLSQPANPQVLGNLTIPGYSNYLHPYDATHVIGLGKDVNASIDADKVHTAGAIYYTAILGVKLSLFDVSDVHNPREVAKIVIGDRGTESAASYDPHAFLFEKSKDMLVIPIDLYENRNVTISTPSDLKIVPPENVTIDVPAPTSAPGFIGGTSTIIEPQLVWQGVYVFKVTLDGGFEVRGTVTQLSSDILANLSQGREYYYYGYDNGYNSFITRSLYIDTPQGTVLYTISNAAVQLNSLDNFAQLAKVELK